MRIEQLRVEAKGGKHRLSAEVIWEDSSRPSMGLFLEVESSQGRHMKPNPHAFLPACTIAALRWGERRVKVEAPVCPELRSGLMTAMRIIRQWYGERYAPNQGLVQVEAPLKKVTHGKRKPAAVFISGGIDSLATLRMNRLHYPLDHPESFGQAFLVRGLQPEIDRKFHQIKEDLHPLVQDAGLELVIVESNIRYLDDDWAFWRDAFEGAVFSSIAHGMAFRAGSVTLSPSYDLVNLHPHGSHPLLDPHYSSAECRFHHDDFTWSRFERTRLVADWPIALAHIRVCNKPEEPGLLNCGRCEKCIRTMLALAALGKLEHTQAFAEPTLTADKVRTSRALNQVSFPFYAELIARLRSSGRADLSIAVEEKIRAYKKGDRWPQRVFKAAKNRFRDYDRRYLNGAMGQIRHSWSRPGEETRSVTKTTAC